MRRAGILLAAVVLAVCSSPIEPTEVTSDPLLQAGPESRQAGGRGNGCKEPGQPGRPDESCQPGRSGENDEGSTDGQEDGQTEGSTDGSTDGQEDGQTEDSPEGSTDGQEDGQTEDPQEGSTDEQTNVRPGSNEPTGFTPISERSFAAVDEDGWIDSRSDLYSSGVESASGAGRAKFPGGATWLDGVSPCSNCAGRRIRGTDGLYLAFRFKVSHNWYGHDGSGRSKIGYVTTQGYGGGGDPVYWALTGIGNDPLRFTVHLQGPGAEESLTSGNSNLPPNVGPAAVDRGAWYDIQMLLIANTADRFDGEVHVWINGTKTHEYRDVRLFHESVDASSHSFDSVRWTPIYGGVGGNPPANGDQYQYMDHFYISGR